MQGRHNNAQWVWQKFWEIPFFSQNQPECQPLHGW
jgi:hypothetical protein